MGNPMSTPVRPKGLQNDIGDPADLKTEYDNSWTILTYVLPPQQISDQSVENLPRAVLETDDIPTDQKTEFQSWAVIKSIAAAHTRTINEDFQRTEAVVSPTEQLDETRPTESSFTETGGHALSVIDEESVQKSHRSAECDSESKSLKSKEDDIKGGCGDNAINDGEEEAAKEKTNEETVQCIETFTDNDTEMPLTDDFSSPHPEAINAQPHIESSCVTRAAVGDDLIRTRTSSLNSPRERKRVVIADVFQRKFEALVEQIDPEEVSRQLYPINVINDNDFEKATNKFISRKDRANDLALLIIRKLRSQPEYYDDVCTVLKNKGVVVVEDIRAQVHQKLQEGTDTEVQFSTGGPNKSSAAVPEKMSDLLASVEESCMTNGVKEFIQSEVEKQPCATPFHDACMRNVSVQTLNILLAESGDYDINAINKDGRTPLHVACASLRLDGALCSIGSMDFQQSIEAQQECMLQQRMKIQNLLKHKPDCTIQDKDGNTALHLATIRNDVNTVRLLLNYCNQCINIANERGNTALHIACREGMEDIVQELCARKANAAIRNKKRERTPMHLACSCGRIPSAKRLAAYDRSTLDSRDKKKLTPLHITCKHCNTTLTSELLKQTKCNPYKIDEELKTPLHYACFWGNPDLVHPILKCERGREFLDAQDRFGDTALHIASRYGHKHIVKLLRDSKANKNIKNAEGKTPAQVAVDCDHNKAAEVLLRKRRLFDMSGKKAVKKLKRSVTVESLPSSISDASDFLFTSEESGCDETL